MALALLVGVGVLVSSGDTSSTTRNAALVVATPCTKPGQVTKVSKQSVICATTNTGSLWYATMKATGKAQGCKSPGEIRKKSDIVWVCGVIKKKKLWQATQPLSALAVEGDLPSTTPATPDAPVIADNAVLADPQIPDDKIVTQVIDTAATQTLAPAVPAALSLRTQPLGGANAVALETQPVVQLLDQRGASISTAGITITAVSGRTDVVLSGNTAVTDATGRATFTTLSLTGKMGDLTLTFTTPGLEGITSDKFVLAAGAATRLVNNTNIGSVVSGQAFDQQPVLHREDSSANVIAVSGVDVIVSSSPPGLSGATTVATNERGSAGFTGLALTQAGATTLTFTSGALRTTTNVTVVAGNYKKVKITTEASEGATNNTAFSRSPVVQLIDANNNNVTTKDITVTATITQFPTADTAKAATLLFPTTAKTNDQGIATFTGLGIKGLIGSYTLGYTPTNGGTQASEKTTTLSAGVATRLSVLSVAASPVGNSAAGTWSLNQSPVIGLRDISNNPVKTSGVTVTATVTGQTQTSTAPTNAQGEATIPIAFNGDSAGDRTIRYSALTLQTDPTTITLPLLTTEVSPGWVLQPRIKSSISFALTRPTSNSNGAWTYIVINGPVASVASDGTVTPSAVGTFTIKATQATTTKYQSVQTTSSLVIALPTPTVQTWVLQPRFKSSISFTLTPPTSSSNGAWSYTSTSPDATITPAGAVTLKDRAGQISITATQAATSEYQSVQTTSSLVTTDGYNVGETGPGGGTVFFVAPGPFASTGSDCRSNCGYLEAAPSTQANVAWCSSVNSQLSVRGTGIGTGMANTTTADVTCDSGAIQVAADYSNNNKLDWHLPSEDELNALCKYAANTGQAANEGWVPCSSKGTLRPGFAAGGYWSSSEQNSQYAEYENFDSGTHLGALKNSPYYVRPVRAFAGPSTPSATVAPKVCTGSGDCNLGDTGPGGGKVFYDAGSTQSWGRFLEAAPTDYLLYGVRKSVEWGCQGTPTAATAIEIGTGKANTTTILTECTTPLIAARVAADYRGGGGKSDWFLPSQHELNELCKYARQTGQAVGGDTACRGGSRDNGFASAYYWSSSEYSAPYAWLQDFDTYGSRYVNPKTAPAYVRPVRAF